MHACILQTQVVYIQEDSLNLTPHKRMKNCAKGPSCQKSMHNYYLQPIFLNFMHVISIKQALTHAGSSYPGLAPRN